MASGLGPLIEEDRLDPRRRRRLKRGRRAWQHDHATTSGGSSLVYMLGVQRSGTNMLARTLEELPTFEVYYESDSRVFRRFLLRDPSVVAAELRRNRSPHVLVKALSDSHRAVELIEEARASGRACKVIWLYRSYEARARSAVSKFGDINQRVMTAIAAGEGARVWQSQGLSARSLKSVRAAVAEGLDAPSGAALFWLVRNQLYFELGLDRRDDCLLVSYERLACDPVAELQRVCAFLGIKYESHMVSAIDVQRPGKGSSVAIAPSVRLACEELSLRLEAAARRAPTVARPAPVTS
jgi:hypothetical protein